MEHQTENPPRPSSVCALPRLMSFSFTQQIAFVCLRFVINCTSWMEKMASKLPVNRYKCTNRLFCLTPRFGAERVLSSVLTLVIVSLLLLMAIVLFTIGEKQAGTFSVADDSPQIRLLWVWVSLFTVCSMYSILWAVMQTGRLIRWQSLLHEGIYS